MLRDGESIIEVRYSCVEGEYYLLTLNLLNRFLSEITDIYDHSFVFGDLNFRLDVSHLHAGWLIGRKGVVFVAAVNMQEAGVCRPPLQNTPTH